MPDKIQAGDIPGLDYVRLIGKDAAARPEIWKTSGLSLVEVGDGVAEIAYAPQPGHRNTVGTVHGGIYGVLLDSAMGCALYSRMPAGKRLATMAYTVHLVRPITGAETAVRVRAEATHMGRRQATARGDILDERGRLLGHGSGTFLQTDTPQTRETEND